MIISPKFDINSSTGGWVIVVPKSQKMAKSSHMTTFSAKGGDSAKGLIHTLYYWSIDKRLTLISFMQPEGGGYISRSTSSSNFTMLKIGCFVPPNPKFCIFSPGICPDIKKTRFFFDFLAILGPILTIPFDKVEVKKSTFSQFYCDFDPHSPGLSGTF